jgi:hypothetical protein
VNALPPLTGRDQRRTNDRHQHPPAPTVQVQQQTLSLPAGPSHGSNGSNGHQSTAEPGSGVPGAHLAPPQMQGCGQQAEDGAPPQRLLVTSCALHRNATRSLPRYTITAGAGVSLTPVCRSLPNAQPGGQQQCTCFADATALVGKAQVAVGTEAGGSPQHLQGAVLDQELGLAAVPDQAQVQEPEEQLDVGGGVASQQQVDGDTDSDLGLGQAGIGHGSASRESGRTPVLPPPGVSAVWPPVQPAAESAPPPGVLPPPGNECQLSHHFAESYGITSTQVLTTSKAPTWWV